MCLTRLVEAVDARIPAVALPELLLEVHAWTGFPNHFHHVSEAGGRAEHLIVSLAAVLVAGACNIGIQAMVSEDEPGRFYVKPGEQTSARLAAETDPAARYFRYGSAENTRQRRRALIS